MKCCWIVNFNVNQLSPISWQAPVFSIGACQLTYTIKFESITYFLAAASAALTFSGVAGNL